jgi:hypothetical protein
MPRGFCGGAGAVKNSFSLGVGFGGLFGAHLASCSLKLRVKLFCKSIDFSVKFGVLKFWKSRFVRSRHALRAFLRWGAIGHTVYPSGQVRPRHYYPGNLLDYGRACLVAPKTSF